MAFANENAYVELYREAFKCQVQDFMISFHKEQMTVEKVLEVTSDLFENLINSYDDRICYRWRTHESFATDFIKIG